MSAPNTLQATWRDLAHWRDVAVRAADAAAEIVRAHRGTGSSLEWQSKGRSDFVSVVDTAAEQRIREVVGSALPDARVVAEEGTPDDAVGAGVTFIVDPLDGTTNFLHDYPEYAVSIAVFADREPAVGVVLNVPHGTRYVGLAGRGATMDDAAMRVSTLTDPSRALIGTGFPFKYPVQIPAYLAQAAVVMRSTAGIRRAGAAALDLCAVAAGRFDAFWEHTLEPWDFAAGALIVREAGGRITTLDNQPLPFARTGVVAGNPALHDWMLTIIAES
jgi:myo-inositol-1(or 4)-monophosphatase